MKQLKIQCGKKQVYITKDTLTIVFGIIIIISDALLAGFINLFEFGFDWSYVSKSEFWSAYFIKLAISYIALFGAYIIRRAKNKKNVKFIAQREKIKDCKNAIVKAKKIGNCKNWLKFILNYTRKVEIYQNIMMSKYEKIIFKEPEEPDYENLSTLKKRLLKNRYEKALEKYKQNEKLRIYIEEQLNVCDKHFKIIECYKKHDISQVKILQEEIKANDGIKGYNLKYKDVTYNKLFNVDLTAGDNDDGIEYNEFTVLLKKIMPTLFLGVIGCALLTSIVIQRGVFNTNTVLLIALNLLMMAWFIFNGVRFADSVVLGTIYAADTNRLIICEQFLEDSAINGDEWVQNIDLRYEPEILNSKDEDGDDG